MTRKTLSTLTLAVLLGPGCATRNQSDEIQRLRAELAAVTAERDQLKKQLTPAAPPNPSPANTEEHAEREAPPTWDAAFAAFSKEAVDKPWRKLREHPLRKLATTHIMETGSRLNIVTCHTSACVIVVDVKAKPRKPYTELKNPWPGCHFLTRVETLGTGDVRHSYLVLRHAKDYESFGAERVDPFATKPPPTSAATPPPAAPVPVTAAPQTAPAQHPAPENPAPQNPPPQKSAPQKSAPQNSPPQSSAPAPTTNTPAQPAKAPAVRTPTTAKPPPQEPAPAPAPKPKSPAPTSAGGTATPPQPSKTPASSPKTANPPSVPAAPQTSGGEHSTAPPPAKSTTK